MSMSMAQTSSSYAGVPASGAAAAPGRLNSTWTRPLVAEVDRAIDVERHRVVVDRYDPPLQGAAVGDSDLDQPGEGAPPVTGLGQGTLDSRGGDLEHVRSGPHRIALVESLGHRGGRSSDGVQLDPTVLVDDHPHQAALAGRGDDYVLQVEAGARHHRCEQGEEGLPIR
jgi:hypothetical protein